MSVASFYFISLSLSSGCPSAVPFFHSPNTKTTRNCSVTGYNLNATNPGTYSSLSWAQVACKTAISLFLPCRVGFRLYFLSQERSTETPSSSVAGASPVSCPKTPMTPRENPQALRRCPVPTRPWALQAMYALSFSVGSHPFLSIASFRHPGSIPAETCTPSSKQYTWSWRGYAWNLSKLEPRLGLASK